MVVVMQEGATEEQIQGVINNLMEMGFDIHRSTGVAQTVLGAVGANPDFDHRGIELLEGVQEVHRISSPYKLASRHFRPEGSLVQLGQGVAVGGEQVVVMAGPCSVESAAQIDKRLRDNYQGYSVDGLYAALGDELPRPEAHAVQLGGDGVRERLRRLGARHSELLAHPPNLAFGCRDSLRRGSCGIAAVGNRVELRARLDRASE